MIVYFVDTEESEQAFYEEELAGETVHFVDSPEEVGPDAEVVSVFIHTRIDKAFLDAHPALRLVSTRSTGFDHIDLEACRERGIATCIVPTYGDNTVAEHTFALLLALSRRLPEATQTEGDFTYASLRGFDLNGKTFGVIGSGRIGLHAIRIAKAFGMRVLAYDLRRNAFMTEILGFEYRPLEELLAESDVISLHIPLRSETVHLLNRETLALCKQGVIIVNTARGGLIDTEALIEALDSGQVGGVGLDVLEEEELLKQEPMEIIGDQIVQRLQSGLNPEELRACGPDRINELQTLMRNSRLIARPNVVFTPHIAFNSQEAVYRINATTLENIRYFITHCEVLNPAP